MPKKTLIELESLQRDIFNLSFDMDLSDTDSSSLRSRSTKATSVCSNASSLGPKLEQTFEPVSKVKADVFSPQKVVAPKKLPFSVKADSVQERIESSALVLECFHDMVSQENALIEAAIASFCDDLAVSVGVNSYDVAKSSLFPFNTK